MKEKRNGNEIALMHWHAALCEAAHLLNELMRSGRREDEDRAVAVSQQIERDRHGTIHAGGLGGRRHGGEHR